VNTYRRRQGRRHRRPHPERKGSGQEDEGLRESTNPQAQFLWAIFRDAFHYIAVHLDTVADNARDIDFAMRWGFGWNVGPFETWQASGWTRWPSGSKKTSTPATHCATHRCQHGYSKAVAEKGGVHTPEGSWSAVSKSFVPRSELAVYERQEFRAPYWARAKRRPQSRHHRARRRRRAHLALGRRRADHLAQNQDARDRPRRDRRLQKAWPKPRRTSRAW
jgi:3-hydroxyacyl-CoA dehydrogenase